MTHPPFCLWGAEFYYPAKARSDWAAAILLASLKSFLQVLLYSRHNVSSTNRAVQRAGETPAILRSKWQLKRKSLAENNCLSVRVAVSVFGK